jgi:hypothetical protein
MGFIQAAEGASRLSQASGRFVPLDESPTPPLRALGRGWGWSPSGAIGTPQLYDPEGRIGWGRPSGRDHPERREACAFNEAPTAGKGQPKRHLTATIEEPRDHAYTGARITPQQRMTPCKYRHR